MIVRMRQQLDTARSAVRRSPRRMALVAGTVVAAVVTGGFLAMSISAGRQAGAEPSVPVALETSPSPQASTVTMTATPSPSAAPSTTPSLAPSPSARSEPATPTPTAAASGSSTPAPNGYGGAAPPSADPGLVVDWESLPAMPTGSEGQIADVAELPSGEIAVFFWDTGAPSIDGEDLVLAYDPETESWRELTLAGDPLSIGTGSEFVTVAGAILQPWSSADRDGLGLRELVESGDELVVTEHGFVEDEYANASEVSVAVLGEMIYVPEHLWSPRSTRFMVYRPDDGVVSRTAATDLHHYDIFTDGRYLYAGSHDEPLSRYDPDLNTWEDFAPEPPSGPSYRHAAATGEGMVWVPSYLDGGEVIWVWSPTADTWQLVELPGNQVRDIHLLTTADGSLYAFTPSGSFVAASPPHP